MEKEPPPWQGKLAKPVQALERTLAEGEAETIESGSRRRSPRSSLKTLITVFFASANRSSPSVAAKASEQEAMKAKP